MTNRLATLELAKTSVPPWTALHVEFATLAGEFEFRHHNTADHLKSMEERTHKLIVGQY